MRRIAVIFLSAAVVPLFATGCAWCSGGSEKPKAGAGETAECAEEIRTVAPAPRPGEDIIARSAMHKESIDDGRDILSELTSPIEPVFKDRTFHELTQVSFTRVGGDDDVDTSHVEDLVVFSSNRHSADHNIYVKAVAGSVVTQKTFKPFDEIQPKFSPDGQQIAFASNKNGSYDIWIMDTHANGTSVQVTSGDEDDLHPAWSPDGACIFYSSYSSRTADWSIMMTDLRSGEVRDLGPGKFPEASPDGAKILFQRARQRDGYWYSIWTMNLDGTSQTEIVTSADWAAINPCWSPDGQYIAFATVNKSPEAKIEDRIWRGDDIYFIGVNGLGMVQLTADTQPDWQPCWSPRDGRIYFISERNGFRNIWSIRPPVLTVASSASGAAGEAGTPQP